MSVTSLVDEKVVYPLEQRHGIAFTATTLPPLTVASPVQRCEAALSDVKAGVSTLFRAASPTRLGMAQGR
jgi:hypothetical protein